MNVVLDQKGKTKASIDKLYDEFVDYCKFSRRLRPETIRSYGETFKTFRKVMYEVNSVDGLIPEVMTQFFKRLETRRRIVGKSTEKVGIKDSTVKTYWSKLDVFFQWLLLNKHINTNPLDGRKPPEPIYDDKRALKKEDVCKILGAISMSTKNPLILRRDNLMVSLLLLCGIRKGELLGLQVRDVDMFNKILTIRAETSKSKKTRKLPINPILYFHLQEYLNERKKHSYKTEYLLVSSKCDGKLTSHGLKHWVERIKRLSGVKFHVHRFRHTFACNLAAKNVGVVSIQKLMGHSDIKMTMSYLRSIDTENLRDEMNKLSIDNLV